MVGVHELFANQNGPIIDLDSRALTFSGRLNFIVNFGSCSRVNCKQMTQQKEVHSKLLNLHTHTHTRSNKLKRQDDTVHTLYIYSSSH